MSETVIEEGMKGSPTEGLNKVLDDLREEMTKLKQLETKNNKRIRQCRMIRNVSSFVASVGFSGSMGLALSVSTMALAAPIAMPTTLAVVLVTFLSSGISYSCHKAIKCFQERSSHIENMANLTRDTEKSIYDRYLQDGSITSQELIKILQDMQDYYSKQASLVQSQ